ncbi:MAG: DNA polymerase III subunit delta [Bacteroidota bacterium]
MNAQEFQGSVKGNSLAPVILLYGDEDFLVDECIHAILAHTLDEGTKGFNLDVVYGTKVDVKEVVALASAFPMMSERRVVIVKEFEKLATTDPAKEQFSAYLQNPLASTCLVLVSLQPDLRKKPFTDLKKRSELVECKSLYDNQVPDWIARRIQALGKSADPQACRVLQAYVGNSLRSLQNEIDKLFIFVGEKKEISGEDVIAVVGASKGYTVFELQNAIGRKDLKEALTILQAMLQAGQSPQMIIVMLTRFFNQLWKLGELKVKRTPDAEMAREVGVHPFFLKQLVQFQAGFTTEQIEGGYRALLEADTVLKSTSRDQRVVMDMMVYALVRGAAKQEQVSDPA